MRAGVLVTLVQDVRAVLRVAEGREPQPSAAVLDSRTLQSTPTSGRRADSDGAKRRRGGKVHMAVDTLGHLVALIVGYLAKSSFDNTVLQSHNSPACSCCAGFSVPLLLTTALRANGVQYGAKEGQPTRRVNEWLVQ